MNCLLLLVLLFCCGNNGCENNCFGMNRCGNDRRNDRRNDRDEECHHHHHNDNNDCRNDNDNNGCSCLNPRDSIRNDDCGCRADVRPEPRLEPRPFISFQGGSTCGCEGSKDN